MPELTYPQFRRRRLSSTAREELYDRCRGSNQFPTCNICGCAVDGTREAWHESHNPNGNPFAIDGNHDVGIAHRDCNLRHGAEVATPLVAHVKRVRRNFIGASVSQHPMPGGRNDSIKRTLSGRVVKREKR